jgi:hypothetical protein
MLRFQQVNTEAKQSWVVSTQSTKSGELRYYSNLDELIQFLQMEFENLEKEQSLDNQAQLESLM